jgi:hypothetical protein
VTVSTSVFVQGNSIPEVNGIPINELYRGNIQLPSDFPLTSVKFFNVITDSLNHVTINLYDENSTLRWKVVIDETASTKTVQYNIYDASSNAEWIKVVSSSENNKNIGTATSSSNKMMKITTTKPEIESCEGKIPVADIEIIVNNGSPRRISTEELPTQKGKANIQSLVAETEEQFYDTAQLKVLQNVIFFMDRLESMVIEESTREQPSEERVAAPRCNIFCVRIATVIPLYICNDTTLNCRRCGVNGVYIIGGYGCFIVCSIPCSEFWWNVA